MEVVEIKVVCGMVLVGVPGEVTVPAPEVVDASPSMQAQALWMRKVSSSQLAANAGIGSPSVYVLQNCPAVSSFLMKALRQLS